MNRTVIDSESNVDRVYDKMRSMADRFGRAVE